LRYKKQFKNLEATSIATGKGCGSDGASAVGGGRHTARGDTILDHNIGPGLPKGWTAVIHAGLGGRGGSGHARNHDRGKAWVGVLVRAEIDGLAARGGVFVTTAITGHD